MILEGLELSFSFRYAILLRRQRRYKTKLVCKSDKIRTCLIFRSPVLETGVERHLYSTPITVGMLYFIRCIYLQTIQIEKLFHLRPLCIFYLYRSFLYLMSHEKLKAYKFRIFCGATGNRTQRQRWCKHHP